MRLTLAFEVDQEVRTKQGQIEEIQAPPHPEKENLKIYFNVYIAYDMSCHLAAPSLRRKPMIGPI
jgi:hypothetical protein